MSEVLYIFIDDVPEILSAFRLFFSNKIPSEEMCFFEKGSEALAYLESVNFSQAFVILDHEMPGISGFDLAIQLKQKFDEKVKIIMFSSLIDGRIAEMAINDGCLEAHVRKGIGSIDDVYFKLMEVKCGFNRKIPTF
jgi:CheY-like chemotaxis protein